MFDGDTTHEDNDTPGATIPEGDERTQNEIDDTPHLADGSTGASLNQGVRVDSAEENNDPKSGGTPVHAAPTEESPRS